jgi:hypothetical protein
MTSVLAVARTRAPVLPEEQRLLNVEFRSPDGHTWTAIGGGATVAAAIAWARECCPGATTWAPVGWSNVYGD